MCLKCVPLNIHLLSPPDEPVPDFRPPFEAELGSSITSEDIQDYVARQKKRPGFPDVWKHNHPVSNFKCSC